MKIEQFEGIFGVLTLNDVSSASTEDIAHIKEISLTSKLKCFYQKRYETWKFHNEEKLLFRKTDIFEGVFILFSLFTYLSFDLRRITSIDIFTNVLSTAQGMG